MSVLSPVSVRARAVIPVPGGIVVARERRRGREHVTIPGGRVAAGESTTATVIREVAEETGLRVEVGPLLYVAEAIASVRRHDLNLIFLATLAGDPEVEFEVVDPASEDPTILPPLLGQIHRDLACGLAERPIWLGNVWRAELAR